MDCPEYLKRTPRIHPSVFVAPSADIVGDVTLHEESSVWYHSVLRGDINRIVLGARSNLQDGSVVHLADDFGVQIGELVTVGHRAIIHACTIEDEVLVGMGAIIMDGCVIGSRSIIGAGTLLTMHQRIPPGSLVMGSPGKVVRTLDLEAQRRVRRTADKYVHIARHFRERSEE